MSILQSWRMVLNPAGGQVHEAEQPGILSMLLGYVIPLSLITPVMLSIVVRQYPDVFNDILPGDRLYIVGFGLFVLQVIAVPIMALISKNLADMVDIKPTFQESFLVMAIAATPFWVVSIFYLIPSFALNIVLHFLAAVMAAYLVYSGIRNVFRLERRGARIMLTIAVVATASVAYGVVLISTIMSWGQVQQLQFGVN